MSKKSDDDRKLAKVKTVSYYLPDGTRCKADTPGAIRKERWSRKWYGRVGGTRVPLEADKVAARRMLDKKCDTYEKYTRHGLEDPAEGAGAEQRRPLTEHLEAYAVYCGSFNNSPGHIAQTVRRTRDVITGCGWKTPDRITFPKAVSRSPARSPSSMSHTDTAT